MSFSFLIDRHSGIPVFRQIEEQVRLAVAGGLLPPGEELPSTRQVSAELGLNPMTVSKAYALLERDGLVERHPGLPLRVGRQPAAARRQQAHAQLLAALRPAARAATQLGLSQTEALDAFRELLAEQAQHPAGQSAEAQSADAPATLSEES